MQSHIVAFMPRYINNGLFPLTAACQHCRTHDDDATLGSARPPPSALSVLYRTPTVPTNQRDSSYCGGAVRTSFSRTAFVEVKNTRAGAGFFRNVDFQNSSERFEDL